MSTALPKSDRVVLRVAFDPGPGSSEAAARSLIKFTLSAGGFAGLTVDSEKDAGSRAAQQVAEEQALHARERRERIAARLLAPLMPTLLVQRDEGGANAVINTATLAADILISKIDAPAPSYDAPGMVCLYLPRNASESDLRAAWAEHRQKMQDRDAGRTP